MDNLRGEGPVTVKATGELAGNFAYQVNTFRRPGSVLRSASVHVDLPVELAMKFLNDNSMLVLRVNDGRVIDFSVSRVNFSTGVCEMTPGGGLVAG